VRSPAFSSEPRKPGEVSGRAKPRTKRLGGVERPMERSLIGPSYAPKLFTMQQNIESIKLFKSLLCTDNNSILQYIIYIILLTV
jgi:hypothetical protein